MAEKASKKFCKPEVIYSSKEWVINKKVVLEITVKEGNDKPYFAKSPENKWLMYIRSADENILANRILVSAMKRKNRDTGTYFTYTQVDKFLLQFLEDNEEISFSEFRKLANINTPTAEKHLINFLALDIIDVKVTDGQINYCLSEKFRADGH